MSIKDKTFEFEGKLVGSIRYCGDNSGSPYFEAETYQKENGEFVNLSYQQSGEHQYSIKIKVDECRFVDENRQIEWGAKP